MIKSDCFAYDQNKNVCKACNDLKCTSCKFYKKKNIKNRSFKKCLSFQGYNLADVSLLFSKN